MNPLAFALLPSPQHVDPSHPEHPRRLEGLAEAAERAFGPSLLVVPAVSAPQEAILAVHPAAHLEFLRRACEQAPAIIDYAPTYVTATSLDDALHAAGATLATLEAVLDGRAAAGFAAVRPPGHHATADRAMGFCLLNNIAIAARRAQRAGIERVMIVDFDVHHGNGTQAVFDDDATVLYISTHQEGIYPGTGAITERGRGAGIGLTVNVPLPSGTGDAGFEAILEQVVAPLARRFRPGLLLVSAGFDAHWRDPLASLQLSTRGFRRLSGSLIEIAREVCDGRILFVLEGGYDPPALQEGILATLASCLGAPAPSDRFGPAPYPSPDIAPILRTVRGLHNL